VPASVAVCFTPPVGCAERIVETIASAQHEMLVQAYEFTAPAVLHALVAAHGRGVDVRVILDKVNVYLDCVRSHQ
jgi:phospholipase D